MLKKQVSLLNWRILSLSLLVVVVAIFPFLGVSMYVVRIATVCLMYIALAISLNLITGFMGQVSLGHAAFYGIGAYTAAILATKLKLNFPITFIAACVVTGIFGMLLAIPALKLKGSYLSIVTLGFCEIIRLIELNWMDLTRGPMGIVSIPPPTFLGFKIDKPNEFYYMCLVLVIISIVLIINLIDSRIGRGLVAIREDEIAAEAMGINVFVYKVMAFTIGAVFAGLMGAFYAQYVRYIDPNLFNFDQSIQILSMIILGGLGSIPGSILGAVLLSVIPELMRGLAEYRMLIYGLLLVIMMLIRPQGLLGNVSIWQLLGIENLHIFKGTKNDYHNKTQIPAGKGGEKL